MSDSKAILSLVLKTAWLEHTSLAVQLTARFKSAKLANDVRSLLLKFPERAIEEPDALQILIGPSLPIDLPFQLKVSIAFLGTLEKADILSICFTGPP